MAASISGIEVCLNTGDVEIPSCPHGPTLLFEKYHQGTMRRFFACSACRDRKDCSFFQWADEQLSAEKKKLRDQCNSDQQPRYSQKQYWQRYKSFKKLKLSQRRFCQDCGELLLPDDDITEHQGHHVMDKVTLRQLRSPTSLLTPLDNNKKNAQYLFADKSVEFTMETIRHLGFSKVLCVGAPRIHEAIMKENKNSSEDGNTARLASECHPLTSLLLDIDHRYAQFYSPKRFCRYNMFNHHFFEGKQSEQVFREFVSNLPGDQVVMVTDPPFGGLVEVLAETVKKISEVWQAEKAGGSELPVLWYFPYFMEPRVTSCLPTFTMLDYKVAYDNHSNFSEGTKSRKYGSPVRIFTNLAPSSVPLPEDEGYRLCDMCERYVSQENLHCFKCETCPSKDGSTYKHCDVCRRCVKPSRIHCRKCQQCVLQDHKCGVPTTAGCFVCGDLSHKRRECPKKGENFKQKKRKKNEYPSSKKLKS